MGLDLIMVKYPGAPGPKFAAAANAYQQAQNAEAPWRAEVGAWPQAAGPCQPIYMPKIGGGAHSVQVAMDRNGCMMANVQGTILSRCC